MISKIKVSAVIIETFLFAAAVKVMWCLGQKAQLFDSDQSMLPVWKLLTSFWPAEFATYLWPIMFCSVRMTADHALNGRWILNGLIQLIAGSSLWTLALIIKFEYLPWLAPIPPSVLGQMFNLAVLMLWGAWICRKFKSHRAKSKEERARKSSPVHPPFDSTPSAPPGA